MRLLGAALVAVVAISVGAGAGAAARTADGPWRDNGRGPWIARVCSLPIPRVAGCNADVVTNSDGQPLATSSPPSGALGPSSFHSAYNLPVNAPSALTVGIVDAYDDPNIESDLGTFDTQYGLPACTSANGCFKKVNQTGGTTYPSRNSGWDLEIALDVETAHAICQNCTILLVEASSASLANLGAAENEAVALGANVVSNSWGASEYSSETSDESTYFKHPGVVITASAGDSGYGPEFPAASQYVTAVGGTTLNVNANGSYGSETVWSGTGSGCSAYEPKPSWQHDTGCTRRTLNDVAADADPNTGAAVYDSVSYNFQSGWFQVGGTSLASPLIASVYALAGNPAAAVYGSTPYGNPGQLHDVTSGSDGSCGGSYLCTATTGFDGPTGLGTPNGLGAFSAAPATVPGQPTGLGAVAGNGSVALSWTAPTNNGGASITGYKIYRGTSSGGETLLTTTTTSGTTYNDSGLANGTTYYYDVAAVNSAGTGPLSTEASATPSATAPGKPTGLSATPGNGSVSLSWTAPTNNGGASITKYNVYRATTSGAEGTTPFATVTTGTTYTDGAASNGTTYYYQVTAVNSVGEGLKSSEVSATPATVPGQPGGLTAAAGSGSVSLSWTAPISNGGAPITKYDVYRGTSPGGESTTPVATVTSGTTYNDTGLTSGTTYYYEVSAVNSAGEGPKSGEASAAPKAPVGDFSLSISSSSGILWGPGNTATYTITINPTNGFSGPVSLAVSGLPAGVTGSFSTNPATSSATLTLTSSTSNFSRATFTVTGTSGTLSHSVTSSVTVF